MRQYEIEARIDRAVELLRKGLDTDAVAQRLGLTPKRLRNMITKRGYTVQGIRAEVTL